MFPQPTTATLRVRSGTMTGSCAGELLPNLDEHACALGRRVAVERVVLDAHGAGVPDLDQRVDAVGDPRAAVAVHARDVRAGLLDVLQVDVEDAIGELVDGVDRVVALRRPPARVDGGAQRGRVADGR